MPMRHLSLQGYKLGKSQSDILILTPRYTSLTISSNALYTYPKLIVVAAYFRERPDIQEFVYTHGRLGTEE